jgi:hypothetical protein
MFGCDLISYGLILLSLYADVSEHSACSMEQCSETSAYKLQTPGNYPEESIQHSEHGEILKAKMIIYSGEHT